MEDVTDSPDDIVFSRCGGVGFALLNRPQALNALTADMCIALRRQLAQWLRDGDIGAIVVEGAGGKAFCAGGDVVKVAQSGKAGDDGWREFFSQEYRMNSAIAKCARPYIALIDGITMGGGVGISVHGDYRVASERTLFAMPETALGLIPDVGGSYFLARLPGALGLYLALTGYRARAADCRYLGIATHYIPSDRLLDVKARLAEFSGPFTLAGVGVLLDDASEDAGDAPLAAWRVDIDRHFGRDSLGAIFESLAEDKSEWAQATLKSLLAMSPTSLALSFEALKRGARLDLDACLKMEYRIVSRIVTEGHDFYEGVRAILVDKDKAPKWSPDRLAEVTLEDIAGYFEDLGSDELDLDAD